MERNYEQRLRLTFSKTGPTRFIGHLDLARALERALNRARIPVSYTQGFNRRPRMQVATALALGVTSECEMADIWLTESRPPADVAAQLAAKMPPGIAILQVDEIDLAEPALQTRTAVSVYEVTLLDPVPSDLADRVTNLLAADEWRQMRQRGRKRKEYDLRPLILDITLDETGEKLTMKLRQEANLTGRPDEALYALGLDPLAARIHRRQLLLKPL